MAEFNIDRQRANTIQNADIINNYARDKDHAQIATTALHAEHYSTAAAHYVAALETQPGDPGLHYALALALLGGVRPNRHTRENITEIQRHLREAQVLPEAQVLSALVSEDYGLFWQRYCDVPASLRGLIDRISTKRAAEIMFHVPAREARTWQELAEKQLREGERVDGSQFRG
ncbi:MAG: hypothetical protein ACRDRR_23580 [Pseudonocardiaceae bacterium]